MRVKEIPEELMCRQQEYIRAVAELNEGKALSAFVDTYGCQQNEADSVDVHLTTVDGVACYVVYVSFDGQHWQYTISGCQSHHIARSIKNRGCGNRRRISHID